MPRSKPSTCWPPLSAWEGSVAKGLTRRQAGAAALQGSSGAKVMHGPLSTESAGWACECVTPAGPLGSARVLKSSVPKYPSSSERHIASLSSPSQNRFTCREEDPPSLVLDRGREIVPPGRQRIAQNLACGRTYCEGAGLSAVQQGRSRGGTHAYRKAIDL